MALTPTALTTTHLQVAVLPGSLGPEEAPARYELALSRVDVQTAIAGLWGSRVDLRPPPPQPATFQEVVQSARQRLRRERLRVDRDELDARRFVLERVRGALVP